MTLQAESVIPKPSAARAILAYSVSQSGTLARFVCRRLTHHQQIAVRILENEKSEAPSVDDVTDQLDIVINEKLSGRSEIRRPEEAEWLNRGTGNRLMRVQTETRLALHRDIENP